jgi:hypothetical protein
MTSCDEFDITRKRPREGGKGNAPLKGTCVLLHNVRGVHVWAIALCFKKIGILEQVQ